MTSLSPAILGQGSATNFDRLVRARMGRQSLGLSPPGLLLVYLDWLVHLGFSPGKRLELLRSRADGRVRLALYAVRSMVLSGTPPVLEPSPGDRRFADPAWRQWPFNLYEQSFLLMQEWWQAATTHVWGVSRHDESVVSFIARQLLDVVAPSNFPLTNPEILQATIEQGGLNLVRGAAEPRGGLGAPGRRSRSPSGAEPFVVGKTVAVTPGKVVLRNQLCEVIQYAPATQTVKAEPILIVPGVDHEVLHPRSLPGQFTRPVPGRAGAHGVHHLVEEPGAGRSGRADGRLPHARGHGGAQGDRGDRAGARVHVVGYCLGGTLAAITAAAMARDGDDRLQSLTLLAAETDFTEAGELMLFIDETEVTFLEDMMWEQGYLDTRQMAGAFQLLRSNDLIWSRMVHDYLMGLRQPLTDLMAWNADGTRLPYRMHSEYLRKLFLNNELAEGRYVVDGRPISLSDIRVPIFAVGTERDHVAPWQSVYRIIQLADTDVSFVLTSGGHNAGIVSEPGHPRRSYQFATIRRARSTLTPTSGRR